MFIDKNIISYRNCILTILIYFMFTYIGNSAFNVILISIDGVKHDDITLMDFTDSISRTGIKALSLKPVYPTQTLPNLATVLTGKMPSENGISANFFKNKYTGEYFSSYDNSHYSSKWQREPFIWSTLNLLNVNTVSVDYPFGNAFVSDEDSPKYIVSKDSEDYLSTLDSIFEVNQRNFVAIYFDEADAAAHKYGNKSKEYTDGLRYIDKEISKIAELLQFKSNTNIIIHSNYGTIDFETDNFIDLNEYIDVENEDFINLGTMCLIYSFPKDEYRAKRNLPDKQFKSYVNDIPSYFDSFTKYNRPLELLTAEPGYVFTDDREKISDLRSLHGYSPEMLDMHGFFAAYGTDLQTEIKTGTLNISQIYDLIMSLYGIKTGNYHGIEFMLGNNSEFFNINQE